jgi:co-chaperonin GroES (HSP10)
MSLDVYAGQTLDEAFPTEVDPQFEPFGARVLVQMRRPQSKSKGGIVLTAETKSDKAFSEQIGKVHSMGPLAFHDRSTMEPWPEGVSAAPGMFVRLPRYGGDVFYTDPKDGGEPIPWKMVNDHEIFGKITGDPLKFKIYIL